MEKQHYYVSVQAGSILNDPSISVFELEIQATDEEVQELRRLFEQRKAIEQANFVRAGLPAIPYHYDEENDAYDNSMSEIYALLSKLGTEQTKTHIAGMNILE